MGLHQGSGQSRDRDRTPPRQEEAPNPNAPLNADQLNWLVEALGRAVTIRSGELRGVRRALSTFLGTRQGGNKYMALLRNEGLAKNTGGRTIPKRVDLLISLAKEA